MEMSILKGKPTILFKGVPVKHIGICIRQTPDGLLNLHVFDTIKYTSLIDSVIVGETLTEVIDHFSDLCCTEGV